MERKKQIVIVESAPTDMLAKMSSLLRKRGYETVLISLLNNDKEFIINSYDERISFDFKFFKARVRQVPSILNYGLKKSPQILKSLNQIRKLRPYVVLTRGTPNWLCFIVKKYFKKYPFIYFPYDIRSFCYRDKNEALSNGVPLFEINAERYCFKNADGIIHKGDEDELRYLDPSILGNVNIRSPTIHFLPYCMKAFMTEPKKKNKLSRKDKELHVVFVGHIATEKEWMQGAEAIVNQKIHLHLYGKTAYLTREESYGKVKHAYHETLNSKFFHLHEPVDQQELSKEISQYDYGIWLANHKGKGKNITMATGNKYASYLEAGLPILYFKNHEAIDRIMRKYDIGIGVTYKELKNLKKILKKKNYSKLIKNILEARKALEMNRHIPRLEKFFEEVVAYKKSRMII